MARTMPIAPLPTTLECVGNRRFSFYPPIVGVESNEWLFQQATWSEMLVVNVYSGREIWIPRRFVGEVSRIEEPVRIVGLLKELEYRDHAVWPHRPRVIQMPKAPDAAPFRATREPARSATVVPISLHSVRGSRKTRTILGSAVIGCFCLSVIAGVVNEPHKRFRRTLPGNIRYRTLQPIDGYSESCRLPLSYPQHSYIAVLQGCNPVIAHSEIPPPRDSPRF